MKKQEDSDYLTERNQHVLIRMRPDSVIMDLVAKIVSFTRAKKQDVCLFRAKFRQGGIRF
jgi:hypothetical protein